jgi:hypothetical protein
VGWGGGGVGLLGLTVGESFLFCLNSACGLWLFSVARGLLFREAEYGARIVDKTP